MSGGHRYEELPRTVRLTDGVRWDRENRRVAIRAQVFRGEVRLSEEEVYLSVDDASVINAQLARVLDSLSQPSPAVRRQLRVQANRAYLGY